MKTPALAILLLLTAVAVKAQQGAVTFANSLGTAIRAGGTNANVRVALYGATSNASLTQVGNITNTFIPGVFIGGTRFLGNPGEIVTLQVRAWTGSYATYELAFAARLTDASAFCACTLPWTQPVGGGTNPSQPITGAGRFTGMRLGKDSFPCPVPEPSGIALAMLAVLVIGFYARRKE